MEYVIHNMELGTNLTRHLCPAIVRSLNKQLQYLLLKFKLIPMRLLEKKLDTNF